MYDEQKPREPEIAPELIALERQLRGIAPVALRVDRDRLMFAAGQAAASSDAGQDGRAIYDRADLAPYIAGPSRAGHRFWPAATFTMTAATLLLATMLVWQRQAHPFASRGDTVLPSVNQTAEPPRREIAPTGQLASSAFDSRLFQRPASGYLGIRYAALRRGVGELEPTSGSSTDDLDSSDGTPRTQRNMLEELLPSTRHQMNPQS